MSRLDSFIRRMTAQRDLLNRAVDDLAQVPGVIFELGLGNGRTFDHLRERFPEREIYVFERKVAAHPDSVPAAPFLIQGEIAETLPEAVERFRGRIALVHNDLGDGVEANRLAIADFVGGAINGALAPEGCVLSNMPLPKLDGVSEQPLPDGIRPGRYFVYRAAV